MNILEKIIAHKKQEVTERKALYPVQLLEKSIYFETPVVSLCKYLQREDKSGIIAEFKRASPSAGVLRDGADPRAIATAYAAAGATAMSVLCDRHFQGSLEDLRTVRQTVTLPLLCKDFILERWQIVEAKRTGADAVLLIVAALEPPHLRQLVAFAHELGMQVLCEAHDAHEVDRAMAAGARMIGVNARDLRTFKLDPELPAKLRDLVPRSFTYVAESGVGSPADAKRLAEAGVDAILIGSYFMKAASPGDALAGVIAGF